MRGRGWKRKTMPNKTKQNWRRKNKKGKGEKNESEIGKSFLFARLRRIIRRTLCFSHSALMRHTGIVSLRFLSPFVFCFFFYFAFFFLYFRSHFSPSSPLFWVLEGEKMRERERERERRRDRERKRENKAEKMRLFEHKRTIWNGDQYNALLAHIVWR